MAKDIYDQHRAAFSNVSAYVIIKDGRRVATIAFKFPKDGASKLWAYVHWFGVSMVRGYAGGYGYDKMTAACASAARHMKSVEPLDSYDWFVSSLSEDGGQHWDNALIERGFTVVQAV